MKLGILILCFSIFGVELSAQVTILNREQVKKMDEYYTLGTKELMRGNYRLADSLLKQSVDIKANSDNVYNYSIARLYLGDTLHFCQNMRNLSLLNEKDAHKMYYFFCAKAETTYYNRKFQKLDIKKKARYYKVTVSDKYLLYKTVYLHDKRKWGLSGIFDIYNPANIIKSNIIATYRLYPNGDTVYTFIPHSPSMIGGSNAYSHFIDSISYVKEAKRKLKLNKVSVYVDITIDKKGNIIDDTIIGTNKPIKKLDELKPYIDKIIFSMPKYKPAVYKNKNVAFCNEISINFW